MIYSSVCSSFWFSGPLWIYFLYTLSVQSFYCLRMVPEFLSLSLSATVTWFTSTATILTTNIATITFNSATWWSVFPTLSKWNILILFLQVNFSFGSLNFYLFPLSIHMRWGRRNQWRKGERETDCKWKAIHIGTNKHFWSFCLFIDTLFLFLVFHSVFFFILSFFLFHSLIPFCLIPLFLLSFYSHYFLILSFSFTLSFFILSFSLFSLCLTHSFFLFHSHILFLFSHSFNTPWNIPAFNPIHT